jgi:hypothetical protein
VGKLDHAILGLSSMTTNIRILKQLHQKGVLRVIKANPHFSNHSYSFQSKDDYVALIVNGHNFSPLENTTPLMSGIVVRCSLSHLFVNQAESFFREFRNQSTIMSSTELDQLEERMIGALTNVDRQRTKTKLETSGNLPKSNLHQSQLELVEKRLSSVLRWPLWNRLKTEAKNNSQDSIYTLETILWNAFGKPAIPDNPSQIYVCTKCDKFPATNIVDGKRYCNDCLL